MMTNGEKISFFHKFLTAVCEAKEVAYPTGYICSFCNMGYSNWQARNFHEWKEHLGCPKYRKKSLWNYLFDMDTDGLPNVKHSWKCADDHCVHCNNESW